MKISYNWLKQYIEIDLPHEKVAELLTNCGLEVESIEEYQSVKGGLEGMLIGKVKSVEKHPNADKLTLTTVDVGHDKVLPIVCGAPNVAQGQKVVVATVGAKLYFDEKELEIKKTKIRGEVSEGMICAEDELGIGTSHEGIMVLDPKAVVGELASDYFNIEKDIVFEIGLTPNRTDATSHFGVARDLAVVLNNLVNDQDISGKYDIEAKKPSVDAFKPDNNERYIDVIIEDVEACPRYTGLTITNITVKESPKWMQERLKAIGVKPINNLVDISNYVLHETGQPLHFFDAEKIKGNKVIIKKLPPKSIFKTLDEIDRELTAEDLMICSAEEGLCIAGVFGGIGSGVIEQTKNVFLESAYFNPTTVRKTSKHHDLHTDASFRFERGADPNITEYAIKRAALLIKEIAGGTISSELVDVYPKKIGKRNVEILYANVDKLIGIKIERDYIKKLLTDLGIIIVKENQNGLDLLIPTFKSDVIREADVIEEILRIYGYNNVDSLDNVNTAISYSKKPDKEFVKNMVSDYLSDIGFSEMMANSLTNSKYAETNPFIDRNNYVKILNPVSIELDVMRQTMLFGGLEAIRRNNNRKLSDLKLYEFGNCYFLNNSETGSKDLISKYREEFHFALFVTGNATMESWYHITNPVSIYYIKSAVNNILRKIGIDIRKLQIENTASEIFNEGLQYKHKDIGIVEFGNIKNSISSQFDIKQEVFYVDFYWDYVLALINENKIDFKVLAKYPEVKRDLSLLLNKDIQYAEIEKIAHQIDKNILKRINLFDIYEGDRIEKNKKSYAISFYLQSDDHTLKDSEIDKLMNKLIKNFENQLGAEIRA